MKLTLRKPSTQRIYEREMARMCKEKGCRLCKLEVIKKIGNFCLAKNQYPYDRLFRINDMLVSIKHKKSLTAKELKEVDLIKRRLSKEGLYDYAFENLPNQASISNHWHIHLLKKE